MFAAIWDVDGTMVDTAELHYRAWCKLAEEIGKPFSRADFTATFGRRNPEIIHQLFDSRFSAGEVAAIGERKEVLYRSEAKDGVDLLPGARALLEGLRAAGFKQGIGSSAPRANVDLILDLTHSRAFFDAVVSSEDTTRGKPNPEVFLIAAQRLAVPPPRCVVFEDAVAGIQAAHAGSMKSVAVRFVGHHPAEKLRAAGANLVVDSLEECSADAVRRLLVECVAGF
jgi:beta-phosphoglucomutase